LSEESLRASDGRPDLYDAQRAINEPFVSSEEPGTQHLVVTTTLPLAVTVEQVLDALQYPRFACWLYEIHSALVSSAVDRGLVSFICWIVLMVSAHRGRYCKLPVVGDFAEKYTNQTKF
jgi:uncharacterized membrane protein